MLSKYLMSEYMNEWRFQFNLNAKCNLNTKKTEMSKQKHFLFATFQMDQQIPFVLQIPCLIQGSLVSLGSSGLREVETNFLEVC